MDKKELLDIVYAIGVIIIAILLAALALYCYKTF